MKNDSLEQPSSLKDIESWSSNGTEDFKVIDTPFDLQNILIADSKLYEVWKRRPFYLDLNEDGDVVIVYLIRDEKTQ